MCFVFIQELLYVRYFPCRNTVSPYAACDASGYFTLALTLLGLLVITFALSALSPVDRVLQIVGDHASHETYEQVRLELGLDQPVYIQFWHYAERLLHGDLGMASSMGQPVLDGVLTTLPATIELATLSLLIGASLGILCGVLCARYAGTPFDFIIRTLTLLGNSVPVFWLGLLMLLLFYATLQWSPGRGGWMISTSIPSRRKPVLC